MGLFSNLFRNSHSKKSAKRVSSRRSQKMEYLLSEKTPFRVTEAFRNLKAAISVSVPKKEGGVAIMVTSAYPEDGKTTVTTNLALMFAQSEAKVILIDADIRKGRVAKYFKCKSASGLSDYLSGQKTLEEVVHVSEVNENLSFITCGTHSPKPYELLESDEMKKLLSELRKEYDYIIIDTPPVLILSDALALSPVTDGSVIVCRHLTSYVSDISQALNTLNFAKSNILGVVVNDYKALTVNKYSYGGYSKYYYYNSYAYDSTDSDVNKTENEENKA